MLSVEPHIRWMIRRDDFVIQSIGEDGLQWKVKEIARHCRNRNCIGVSAEYGEQVVGFMMYELHKHKIHLVNLGVRREFRRNNIGSVMLRKLFTKLHPERRTRVSTIIPDKFLGMHCLLRKHGFRAVKCLRNHFEDADGYQFVYRMENKKGGDAYACE